MLKDTIEIDGVKYKRVEEKKPEPKHWRLSEPIDFVPYDETSFLMRLPNEEIASIEKNKQLLLNDIWREEDHVIYGIEVKKRADENLGSYHVDYSLHTGKFSVFRAPSHHFPGEFPSFKSRESAEYIIAKYGERIKKYLLR